MSTLVTEDGSLIDDANSYVTVAEADAYCQSSASEWCQWWLAITDNRLKIGYLIDAARAMDNLPWLGQRMRSGDGRALPRSGLCDLRGNELDDDAITQSQKDCQSEWAAWTAYFGHREESDGNLQSFSLGNTGGTYAGSQRSDRLPPRAIGFVRHQLRSHGRVERVG